MTDELKRCRFCGEIHPVSEHSTHVLTSEGWKPVKYISFEPPKWYLRPLIWLMKLFIKEEAQ